MKILKICGKVLLIIVIIIAVILVIGLLFLEFYPSVGDTPDKEKQKEYGAKTDLYYEKQFHNELDFEVMTGEASPKSDRNVPENKLPAETPESIERAKSGEMKITWLGHSSSLLQMNDKNILIDPIMSDRASPVGFAGPARFAEYAFDTNTVPEIDVLFISHDHYDHLDYNTIKTIDSKVSNYIVPLGIDVILKGWGIDENKLHPLYWWESIELEGISYTVTPAEHYTGRNPLKNNATLWGGLYIKDSSHNFYYTGDTGYYDLFEQVQIGSARNYPYVPRRNSAGCKGRSRKLADTRSLGRIFTLKSRLGRTAAESCKGGRRAGREHCNAEDRSDREL